MILDLNQLPFNVVMPIVKWCYERNIDRSKCAELINEWHSKPPYNNKIEWTLEVPKEYMSFITLKWLS